MQVHISEGLIYLQRILSDSEEHMEVMAKVIISTYILTNISISAKLVFLKTDFSPFMGCFKDFF